VEMHKKEFKSIYSLKRRL